MIHILERQGTYKPKMLISYYDCPKLNYSKRQLLHKQSCTLYTNKNSAKESVRLLRLQSLGQRLSIL